MEDEDFESNSPEGKRVSAHLEDLKYRQLQKLSKTLKLPSNLKKQYLLEVIQASNAGHTSEIEEIVMRAKMEKMGTKPVKEKEKKFKLKQLATKLLSTNENKMLPIKPRPNRSARHSNESAVVVRYNENPDKNIIRTRAKKDLLLCSDNNYHENKSTMDKNNNRYHEPVDIVKYESYSAKETKDMNYNIQNEVTSKKCHKRSLKSLLLAPDSTPVKYKESEIGDIDLLSPRSYDMDYPKKQIPLTRKPIVHQPQSKPCSKKDSIWNQSDMVKGTIKYIPLGKKCEQKIRFLQKRQTGTEQTDKINLEKKVLQNNSNKYSVPYLQKREEKDVLDFDGISKNSTSALHPCENSSNLSLEMQRDDSDYFIQEIGHSSLLDSTNNSFTDSGITSEILIDSLENTDINLMADNFLLKDLVEMINEDSGKDNLKMDDIKIDTIKMDNHSNRDIDNSDDLSYLLPYMDGFERFTDKDDLDQLGQMDVNTFTEKQNDNENLSDIDSLFNINTDDLFKMDCKVPENIVSDTSVSKIHTSFENTVLESVISSEETVGLMDDSLQLAETATVNTEDFLQKVPKLSSPNLIDKKNDISFPLILQYLQNTEFEMEDHKMASASPIVSNEDTGTSDVLFTDTNTLQLYEDAMSLICHSNILSNDSDNSDCFYCTWRGNLLSMDDHIRRIHNNYIQTASDTGSMEQTVSLRSVLACPNQCLPVVILAYGTLLFLRVNHQGRQILANLSSIPSHSTDHQNMSGTIEIFSKDGYQSFLWTGAIQPKDKDCSYFNFNPNENCLKVHLSDIGYSATNSNGENENSTLATLEYENDPHLKFRIKVDCTY